MAKKKLTRDSAQYSLDRNGCFVIENYNQSNPFSSFFPGIAGIWGIPMWCFYVNRGQCISSFGIEGKDKAMLEFQPANKAYRLTSLHGFRTFLKIKSGNKLKYWEPFQANSAAGESRQKLYLTAHDLTLEDYHPGLGLVVRVNYYTMPEEDFPALVRRVSIENISRKRLFVELIDGLPTILPYGVKDWLAKNLSRTVEAWMKVSNLRNKAPFYHLNVEVEDSSVVKYIHEGNFYFSFDPHAPKINLYNPIVEAVCVFGRSTDLVFPQNFFKQGNFKIINPQQTSNRTPSALSYDRFPLSAGRNKDIVSLVGYASSVNHLQKIVRRALTPGFIKDKAEKNKKIVCSVQNYAFTNSSSNHFNLYCSQTFLDNVLRGGLPISLDTEEGAIAFNVYSRKHGDLERDYNYFVLSPTYYSQGNGNFRDVNQNRRNDIWFNRDVKESSIVDFLNLMQADGYNPLVVKGMTFVINDLSLIDKIVKNCVKGDTDFLRDLLQSGFQPGALLQSLERHDHVSLKVSKSKFLQNVLAVSHKQCMADHGEGFWSDHWTYNLDLIESYLSLYPENLRSLLIEQKDFQFYRNSHYVVPRVERFMINSRGVVRQYHSVRSGDSEPGHVLRTGNGLGEIYHTHLFAKLLCIVVNKAATIDPSGVGIEMEADKPNWYDALNGLPGLVGSSISELFELKRLCQFLLCSLERLGLDDDYPINFFSELAGFSKQLKAALCECEDPFEYWQKSNDIKEAYRLSIRQGIEGVEVEIPVKDIQDFLCLIVGTTEQGIERVQDKKGLFPTYFYHEVMEYESVHQEGAHTFVRPLQFKRRALPYFLEGFVHALKVEKDIKRARQIYRKVKQSPLYDKGLKMYKVNSDLSAESEEIGRTRIFPAGWLENESIWLHMEYKYLLELIRAELFDEFYETLQNVLIPFQDPSQYGRSTLENSSFIVSSAHEDQALHGMGFVARLSGSTAEFMHIWLTMNVGKDPFLLDSNGEINLTLQPVLQGWLFTKTPTTVSYLNQDLEWCSITFSKNTYAFQFLGSILVVYHNHERKNTFGKDAVQIQKIVLTYPHSTSQIKIVGSTIPPLHSQEIRNRDVERIDVYFGSE